MHGTWPKFNCLQSSSGERTRRLWFASPTMRLSSPHPRFSGSLDPERDETYGNPEHSSIRSSFQFSIIDNRPLHGMNHVCEKHGLKLLTYGTLVRVFFYLPGTPLTNKFIYRSHFAHYYRHAKTKLPLGLQQKTTIPSSVEASFPTGGLANQNRICIPQISHPPNER